MTGFWLVKRPKHLKPADLDMYSNIPTDEELECEYEEDPKPQNWFMKAFSFIFA